MRWAWMQSLTRSSKERLRSKRYALANSRSLSRFVLQSTSLKFFVLIYPDVRVRALFCLPLLCKAPAPAKPVAKTGLSVMDEIVKKIKSKDYALQGETFDSSRFCFASMRYRRRTRPLPPGPVRKTADGRLRLPPSSTPPALAKTTMTATGVKREEVRVLVR